MADTDRPWLYLVRETFPRALDHDDVTIKKLPTTGPFKPPARDAVAIHVEWTEDACHVTWQMGAYWKDDDDG